MGIYRIISRARGQERGLYVGLCRMALPGGSRMGGVGFMDQWELVNVCMST